MSESAYVLIVLGAIVLCADWLERRSVSPGGTSPEVSKKLTPSRA